MRGTGQGQGIPGSHLPFLCLLMPANSQKKELKIPHTVNNLQERF
jgi:hypothetical protein